MSECARQRLGIWLISANPDLMNPDWAEILAKEWDYWAWSLGKHVTWGMTSQTKCTIAQIITCAYATSHTRWLRRMFFYTFKITLKQTQRGHVRRVSQLMVHTEVRRGLSQCVCMWDGQTESDYSTGKHPLAAVLTKTRRMTHKSHMRVFSMAWKSLPLCLSSNRNISLFHICRCQATDYFFETLNCTKTYSAGVWLAVCKSIWKAICTANRARQN